MSLANDEMTAEQKKKYLYDNHIIVVEETLTKVTPAIEFKECIKRLQLEIVAKIKDLGLLLPSMYQLEATSIEDGDNVTILIYCKRTDFEGEYKETEARITEGHEHMAEWDKNTRLIKRK